MTHEHYVWVPVIRSTRYLAERIEYLRVTFTYRDLNLIPRQVITGSWKSSPETMMWSALKWALPADEFARMDDMPLSAVRAELTWWEKKCGITLREVTGILRTVEAHSSALEFDLIQAGLRLRDFPNDRHHWRDLLVFIRHLDCHSRLFKATNPDAAHWDLNAQLLAEIVDTQHWLAWAKTEAAQDPSTAPDPWPRPGVTPKEDTLFERAAKTKPMTLDRAKEVFARPEDPDRAKKLYTMFRNG